MNRKLWLLGLVLPVAGLVSRAEDALEAGFRAPSAEVRPMTWWHWMNGSVTKAGIRAELEDMKRVGIAGVQMLDVTPGFTKETEYPAGPVRWGTDAWHEHVQYAIRTAAELGLKFGMHNCAGWSESGGPWVQLDDSMKKVVWSETTVTGGQRVRTVLAQPKSNFDYYRDIAVVAVPADPEPDAVKAVLTCSVPNLDVAKLGDGEVTPESVVTFPKGTESPVLTLAFPEPVERRLMVISAPYQRGAEVRLAGAIEAAEDGVNFRRVRTFGFPGGLYAHKGYIGADLVLTVPFAPVRARAFRVVFKGEINPLNLTEVAFSRAYRVENYQSKTLTSPLGSLLPPAGAPVQDPAAIPVARVLDLTPRVDAGGALDWVAPEGRWTILRMGYTTTGLPNHPAQPEGTGLEVDKMDRAAVRRHWDSALGRVLREAGPLVGRTFTSVLSDSWEAAQQNWTAAFEAEFRQRRGYELKAYLPVLTGRVVGSSADAEGFLEDYRRTCSDLIAENYFGAMRGLAEEHGLLYYGESYGGKAYNEYQAALNVGVNMAEFWFNRDRSKFNVGGIKARASIAHARGSALLAAESFTATQGEAGWAANPALLKPIGDLAFVNGLTQIFLHSYVHQPYEGLMPGFTVGSSGSNFNRYNTWWARADAWMDYLARCQFLLRQGDFVADVLLVKTAGIGSFQADQFPEVPAGYDYDEADPSLLANATVQAGRVRLASGASYRVVVLPAVWLADLEGLRQLGALVKAGAWVVGPRPFAPRGRLEPAARAAWQQKVDELWAPTGKRWVRAGSDLPVMLSEATMTPDCVIEQAQGTTPVRFLHRRSAAADIYFLATTSERSVRFTADFRVSGRQPELWDAVTGKRWKAPVFRTERGRTQLDLALGDAGSVFVVFRETSPTRHAGEVKDVQGSTVYLGEGLVAGGGGGQGFATAGGAYRVRWSDGREQTLSVAGWEPVAVNSPWAVTFRTPFGRTFGRELARLSSWAEGDEEVKYFSGAAVYRTEFDVSVEARREGSQAVLDLGAVGDLAVVTLNGKALGTLWAPPYLVDVSTALRSGRNVLEIEVRNRWVNRLLGDFRFPQDIEYQQVQKHLGRSWGIIAKFPAWMSDPVQRPQAARTTFTTYQTNYRPDEVPPPSGLIGPVQVRFHPAMDLGPTKH